MSPRRPASLGRLAGVSLMLLLWLATLVVAISPDLHRLLHRDSPSGKHDCLVTQLGKSQALAAACPAVAITANPGSLVPLRRAAPPFATWPLARLSPSRAPPAPPAGETD